MLKTNNSTKTHSVDILQRRNLRFQPQFGGKDTVAAAIVPTLKRRESEGLNIPHIQ